MRMFSNRAILCGLCFAVLGWVAPQAALAQGWGTLTGQFVYDGTPPELPALVKKGDATARDAAVCAAEAVPDESLVVDPETKGIKYIFVYFRQAPSAIHPDLQKSKKETVEFDQKGCRFVPHAMVVRTDQKVKCVSSDATAHNVHPTPFFNAAQNFIISPNDQTGYLVSMPLPERLPTEVKCDIHSWMKAYWLIVNHPYAAVTDAQGKFTIEKIPAGTHTVAVWQEKAGYVEAKLNFEIKPGETTDLGTIKVSPAKFKD